MKRKVLQRGNNKERERMRKAGQIERINKEKQIKERERMGKVKRMVKDEGLRKRKDGERERIEKVKGWVRSQNVERERGEKEKGWRKRKEKIKIQTIFKKVLRLKEKS